MPYYAVAVGKNAGIFENWNDCKLSVSGFRCAIYTPFLISIADYYLSSKLSKISLFILYL